MTSLISRLSEQFARARQRLRPAPHLERLAVHNAARWGSAVDAAAQTQLYRQSPWVYIAVNRIAEAGALVPLRIRPRFPLPNSERAAAAPHPLQLLLDAPNPFISRFELLEQTLGMLELTGNAYWFLAGEDGVPTEIWPLRPDRVRIVPDPAQLIKGYIYEIDGQRIPLSPLEVVHFKRWHPSDDLYGLSALEAARMAVTSDRAMSEWNRNTFGQDNGVPAGIVAIKDHISDADFERVKAEWRQSYGGPQRRTAFLRGGTVEWHNIGLSHHELDFLQGRQAHRDEILNIFGIPVGLLSENATEANATVAERLFIERTLWPKLVRIAQKISQDLLPFWPGAYEAEFEDIRPTDAQIRLDEIRAAYPVLSVNEIRERYYRLPATLWGQFPVDARKQLVPLEAQASVESFAGQAAAPEAPEARKSQPGTALRELRRWERFALRRHGRVGRRPFYVRAVPDEIAFELSAELLAADGEAEIKAAFASAYARLTEVPEPEFVLMK